MRIVGDLEELISTWRISSWYCDQFEPPEADTHNACGLMTVSSSFQLPGKLKFHFRHFNVQTASLSLVLAPIYKHSAVMFISPTFRPCPFAQLSLLSRHRSQQSCRIQSLYPPGHPVRGTVLRGAPKGTSFILALKWKLGDWLVCWDCVNTVVGSNPTEVITVCEVTLFLCYRMCMFSLLATVQTMLKLCNTFHWRFSQIPNTWCVMHDVSVSDATFWGPAGTLARYKSTPLQYRECNLPYS
jgi:hypothetical protein